jgi:hypothetical protein
MSNLVQSESDKPVTEKVEIRLCIGLVGVCVIGLLGDESEGVYSHINELGSEAWYEQLPEHDKPIEGIYIIVCDVAYTNNSMSYSIRSVQEDSAN